MTDMRKFFGLVLDNRHMTSKKKLLLINPPPDPNVGSLLHLESLGLGYLAAAVRQHLGDTHEVSLWDCAIVDPQMSHIPEVLAAVKPDYVGLSLTSMNGGQGAALAASIKAQTPGVRIILGGILASVLPASELAAFYPDAIIRGEGERLIVQVLNAFEDAGSRGGTDEPDAVAAPDLSQDAALDVDSLGWPSRDMLPWQLRRHPQVSVSASRGCPYRCAFCSIPQPGAVRKWRPRDIEDVVEEMARLHRDYNASHFYFVDDNFLLNTNASFARTEKFAQLVSDKLPHIRFGFMCRSEAIDKPLFRVLKKAGLSGVFLGIESFSQPVLDRYKKRETVEEHIQAISILNELGITINPGFIFFDPWTNASEISDTINVMHRINFPALQSINSKLTCYKGTDLERKMPDMESSSPMPGIKPYAFQNKKTDDLFKKCCDLFYRNLTRVQEYVEYQNYNYYLGYLQPYCQSTPYERTYKKYYDGCQAQWKIGDIAILQWIKKFVNEDLEGVDDIDRLIQVKSLPHWRNGNALAQRFLGHSQSFFPAMISSEESGKARLTALAFTSPYAFLSIDALFERFSVITKENHRVLAEIMAFYKGEHADRLFGMLLADCEEDTAIAAIQSSLTMSYAPIVSMVETSFSRRNLAMSSELQAHIQRASRFFALGYSERILGYRVPCSNMAGYQAD